MTTLVLIPKRFLTPLHTLYPLSHHSPKSFLFPFSNLEKKKKLKNKTHKASDLTKQNPQKASNHQPLTTSKTHKPYDHRPPAKPNKPSTTSKATTSTKPTNPEPPTTSKTHKPISNTNTDHPTTNLEPETQTKTHKNPTHSQKTKFSITNPNQNQPTTKFTTTAWCRI